MNKFIKIFKTISPSTILLSILVMASICTNMYSVKFENPFVVMNPERRLTREELIKAVRLMISAEYEATQNYMQIAETNDDPLVKRVFTDIANEERVHAGEFLRLLNYLEPEESRFYKEGALEVEAEMKKLGIKFSSEIPEKKESEPSEQNKEVKTPEKESEKSIESKIAEQMDQAIEMSLKSESKESKQEEKPAQIKDEKELEDKPEEIKAQIPAEKITDMPIEEKFEEKSELKKEEKAPEQEKSEEKQSTETKAETQAEVKAPENEQFTIAPEIAPETSGIPQEALTDRLTDEQKKFDVKSLITDKLNEVTKK